jgi:hypothetical protein
MAANNGNGEIIISGGKRASAIAMAISGVKNQQRLKALSSSEINNENNGSDGSGSGAEAAKESQ